MRDFTEGFPEKDSASVEYSFHDIEGVKYVHLAFFRRDKRIQFPIFRNGLFAVPPLYPTKGITCGELDDIARAYLDVAFECFDGL